MTAPFYRFVLRYPRSVIGLTIALTVYFGWQARNVELNNSIEAILPQGHSAVAQDREIKQLFQSRELILIAVLHADGIFNSGTLGGSTSTARRTSRFLFGRFKQNKRLHVRLKYTY